MTQTTDIDDAQARLAEIRDLKDTVAALREELETTHRDEQDAIKRAIAEANDEIS